MKKLLSILAVCSFLTIGISNVYAFEKIVHQTNKSILNLTKENLQFNVNDDLYHVVYQEIISQSNNFYKSDNEVATLNTISVTIWDGQTKLFRGSKVEKSKIYTIKYCVLDGDLAFFAQNEKIINILTSSLKVNLVLTTENVVFNVGEILYDKVRTVIAAQSNGSYQNANAVASQDTIVIMITDSEGKQILDSEASVALANKTYTINCNVTSENAVFNPISRQINITTFAKCLILTSLDLVFKVGDDLYDKVLTAIVAQSNNIYKSIIDVQNSKTVKINIFAGIVKVKGGQKAIINQIYTVKYKILANDNAFAKTNWTQIKITSLANNLLLTKENLIFKVNNNLYDAVYQAIVNQSNGIYKNINDVKYISSITVMIWCNDVLISEKQNALKNKIYRVGCRIMNNNNVFLPSDVIVNITTSN